VLAVNSATRLHPTFARFPLHLRPLCNAQSLKGCSALSSVALGQRAFEVTQHNREHNGVEGQQRD
jgi:hypothetical protein